MRQRELKRLKAILVELTLVQRRELMSELRAAEGQEESVGVIEDRGSPGSGPHCASQEVVRNGSANGLQRYKCRGCRRTFNALTGTPLARLRQKRGWLDQAEALRDGITITQAAIRLNVARSTAFRWRHRFMALPKIVQAQSLRGIAEADETFFLRSNKGQLLTQTGSKTKEARWQGGQTRIIEREQVPVLVARDRAGATADFILAADSKANIVASLKPILASDAILCTDGSSMLAAAAKEIGITHRPVNVSAGQRVIAGVYHIQNVNAYDSRLKNWIRRFYGVATKYLDSYLGWFRALDRSGPGGFKPASFLALAAGR